MNSLPPSDLGVRVDDFRRLHRVGLVTILFTDIVGSTELKQKHGDARAVALIQQHHAVARDTLGQIADAEEIETAGDSFLLVFARPSDAVQFAVRLGIRLRELAQQTGVAVLDRIGIHLGEVFLQEQADATKLFGTQVDICARVMSMGVANQILMTRAVFDSARGALHHHELERVSSLNWLSHGPYLFKGLEEPMEVCEVRAGPPGVVSAPADTDKARRVTVEGDLVLGWRPAVSQVVPNTRWVLEEKLGEGGFGEVWKARHEKFPERRVFKFCFRADRVRSLKREATLFRLLRERVGEHPNLVKLHDIDFDHPPFYLEEEYVPGRDLRQWSQAQGGVDKLALETRWEIVAQAAEGLQAAHDAGVIHRDVKPGNILIADVRLATCDLGKAVPAEERPCIQGAALPAVTSEAGPPSHSANQKPQIQVKLTDFGIGQVVSEQALAGVTRAGFTMTMLATPASHTGTQLYLAPELLAGKPASIRSDIYSLGVVLYQLWVGDFGRPVTTDWRKQIGDPLIAQDLELCFAGDPQDRFGSAAELAKRLRGLPERRTELSRREAASKALELAAYRRGVVRAAAVGLAIVAVVAVLGALALVESGKAKAAALRAQAGEGGALRNLYDADMLLAQEALAANNLGRAVELLDKYRPDRGPGGLRGWEWRHLWQACRSDALRSFPGHNRSITEMAFSPSGAVFASSSEDMTVKVWDLNTCSNLARFDLGAPVRTVAFSSDGRKLVAGQEDGRITFWDTSTWTRANVITNDRPVRKLAFAPDGLHLVIKDTHFTKLWNLARGSAERAFEAPQSMDQVHGAAFSPVGQWLAYSKSDTAVGLWNLSNRSERIVQSDQMNRITSLAFSPDSRRLAVADWLPSVHVFDLGKGELLARLTNHSAWISCVAFTPDAKTLATASADQTIRLWNTETWGERFTLRGHFDEISALAIAEDGTRLASGSKDGEIKLWNTAAPRRLDAVIDLEHLGAALAPDGNSLAVLNTNRTVSRWDLVLLREVARNPTALPATSKMALSPGGKLLALGYADGTVGLLEATTFKLLAQVPASNRILWVGPFSADGTRLFIVDAGTVRVWDVGEAKLAARWAFADRGLESVAISQTGHLLALGYQDGRMRLRDVGGRKDLITVSMMQAQLHALAFSPDSKVLAAGDFLARAKLWDLTTHRELTVWDALSHHQAKVTLSRALMAYFSVAFSPGGERLAAAAAEGVVKIFDVSTGRDVAALKADPFIGDRVPITFSADGTRLIGVAPHRLFVWVAPPFAETDSDHAERGSGKLSTPAD